MPYKVVKKGDVYKLYKMSEKKYSKINFKTKATAINQAKNWMRYRREIPYVKGSYILNKKSKKSKKIE